MKNKRLTKEELNKKYSKIGEAEYVAHKKYAHKAKKDLEKEYKL